MLEEVEKQEKVRQLKIQRFPEEPSPGKDTVLIKVKHATLGTIQQHFYSYENMLSVYDWVGSLSLVPMHFELGNTQGVKYMPEQSVHEAKLHALHMIECEPTPNITDDDVTSKGLGGSNEDNNDDTITLEAQEVNLVADDQQHPLPDNQQTEM